MTSGSLRAVLFDVDGTLLDTKYPHAVTWWRHVGCLGHDLGEASDEGQLLEVHQYFDYDGLHSRRNMQVCIVRRGIT